jgi:hypothetical protein
LLTNFENIHRLETMSDLGYQILSVVQGWTKTQLVGIELGQQAVVVHKIEWALTLMGYREQVLTNPLDEADMRVVRVTAKGLSQAKR